MNYISLLNKFWIAHESERFSPCEMAMYFYLLKRFNDARWPDELSVSLESITLGTGTHKQTILNARKHLADVGLIDIKAGKKGRGSCATFSLKNVQLNGTKIDHLIRHFNEEKVHENGTILDHFSKEEISPITPKEENNINNIYLASRESRDAHTRVSEMDSIEQLRMHFSQRMAKESLMKNNRISEEEYRMLVEEILNEWQIAEGNEFRVDSDRKRHLISTLRIKANILRENKGGAPKSRQECKQELLTSALANLNNAINEIDKQPLISANEPV
ncbi:MAG: hypothetical protein UH853_05165 [Muribaculaceae bacterium]|nr:hypothetical protein [Muribaculaceae bacterium]